MTRTFAASPWDRLEPQATRARQHADGIVDLSMGTPVDPVPELIQAALGAAADAPGYPTTHGTLALRMAAAGWLQRRFGVSGVDPNSVLPTLGAKELVAWLPTLLELGPTSGAVALPALSYPTYDVGARMAGAPVLVSDSLLGLGPARVAMVWVNSPSNPTGKVLGVDHLRKVVSWARDRGAVVVSDECYLEFGWESTPVSVLHPDVCDGSFEGLLAVQSLSKRSNLAGYRAGFVTGDGALIGQLLELRKQLGMIMPTPVQAAMTAALDDDAHVDAQRAVYAARRAVLRPALEAAGFTIEHSEAGLYLWATRGEDGWVSTEWLAELGILTVPGAFYGATGGRHVRVALTATDERIAAAAGRLEQP